MQGEDIEDAHHRHRALQKLRRELAKDIAKAAKIAEACGLWDLLLLCYNLHLTRVGLVMLPNHGELNGFANTAVLLMREEAIKYAIGLVAKHGSWSEHADAIHGYGEFSSDRIEALERIARHINAKFEMEGFLHVGKVRVTGERDQDCSIDLEAGLRDPTRAMHFHYGLRMERVTTQGNKQVLLTPDLVRRLYREFSGVNAMFEAQCGVSLEAFCTGLIHLDLVLKDRVQAILDVIGERTTDSFQVADIRTFVGMSRAIFFTDAELAASFTPAFISYLRTHPFVPAEASDTELRFHYLTRRPFLMGAGFAVLSPELCFDSVLRNAHFTLLEEAESKPKYMAAAASSFLDRIADSAAAYGYEEVDREIDLFEGKRKLGDIDLILNNPTTNHTILVEGKNHALPLEVYFRSPEAIDAHVARTRDWEEKVQRRIVHLRSASPNYSVAGSWDYIIVSRMPEPLSHLSDLLILSIDELELWFSRSPRDTSFVQFYDNVYVQEHPDVSEDELRDLYEAGYVLARPTQSESD